MARPAVPRIGIAGGARKLTAIRAALEGGLLTGLITDQATARALVETMEEAHRALDMAALASE
jgi:DNA-binding transcriptional regulator LsrR (DeoR family)